MLAAATSLLDAADASKRAALQAKDKKLRRAAKELAELRIQCDSAAALLSSPLASSILLPTSSFLAAAAAGDQQQQQRQQQQH